ncbi:MAG TPA: helix-hairpin-helix domain-containing protein [Ignavibacteriaceae bacterium]|nr:helix-hairpin-helix domain-containing protein [Ignavibacteriaceae bacterium]
MIINDLKYLPVFLLIIFPISQIQIFPQTDSTYITTEEVLEEILQEPIVETDNSDLYEIMEQLLREPINLNEAQLADLQRIPGMDLSSAQLIISHRNNYGKFFSISELNAVQNLDRNLIKNISPFIYVTTQSSEPVEQGSSVENFLGSTNLLFRSRFANDLQTRSGFTEGDYEGTKPRVYNRLLLKYQNQIQAGIIIEKDPGEISLYEYNSYHFAINDIGILHRAVIMDYILEFGQGLVFWSPYAFSKGADAIYPVKRNDKFIRPYTSSTEVNFLRGAAASVMIDKFFFTAFYSNNSFDANIDTLTGEITSLPLDGYHRTENEISKKGAASEKLFGGRIDYFNEKIFKAGILHYQSQFSNSFYQSSIYDISGSEFNFTSFYYDVYIDRINLFGEAAYNGISIASLNAIQIAVTRDFSFIASIRNYPRNFISIHGYGFGERSGLTSNEFGIYTGFRWRTFFGLINFYYDQFKFPYATFSNRQPSEGDEFLIDLISKPFSKFETRARYKYEKKDVPETLNNTSQLVKRLRQSVRFELIYNVSKMLRLKGRFEYNNVDVNELNETENGYLVFQDIRFTPTPDFNLYGRIMFFSTDSFESAVYEYENNLTGVLTNIALFGEGIRWYLLMRYKAMKFITISFKYSETYKPGEQTISSGSNEIRNNVENIISLQIDINL